MPRPTPQAIADALETLEQFIGNADETEGLLAGSAVDVLRDAAKLPELMGASEAAATVGVSPSNLARVAGLPEPLYPSTRGSGTGGGRGAMYEAEAIRELARTRLAAAAS